MKLKTTTVGNSAGIILAKEPLARLRLQKGDGLYALQSPDGIRLTAFDPALAEQMEVAERARSSVRRLAARTHPVRTRHRRARAKGEVRAPG